MTQRRAAVILAAGFAFTVALTVVLGLLDVHWAITGPLAGLLVGLVVRYVMTQPRT